MDKKFFAAFQLNFFCGGSYFFLNGVMVVLFLSMCLYNRAFCPMFAHVLAKLNPSNGHRQNKKLLAQTIQFYDSSRGYEFFCDWFKTLSKHVTTQLNNWLKKHFKLLQINQFINFFYQQCIAITSPTLYGPSSFQHIHFKWTHLNVSPYVLSSWFSHTAEIYKHFILVVLIYSMLVMAVTTFQIDQVNWKERKCHTWHSVLFSNHPFSVISSICVTSHSASAWFVLHFHSAARIFFCIAFMEDSHRKVLNKWPTICMNLTGSDCPRNYKNIL